MGRRKNDKFGLRVISARLKNIVDAYFKAYPEHTQKDLASKIGCSDRMLRKYLSAEAKPSNAVFEKIIAELNCVGATKEMFDINEKTYEDLYRYDSNFATERARDLVSFANKIGLDLMLCKSISKLVDFDNYFPVYIPICGNAASETDSGNEGHLTQWKRNAIFIDSAPVSSKDKNELDMLEFLQLHREERLITMSKPDLAFLKDLQDYLTIAVKVFFDNRIAQMEKETREYNTKYHERHNSEHQHAFAKPDTELLDIIDPYWRYSSAKIAFEEGKPQGFDSIEELEKALSEAKKGSCSCTTAKFGPSGIEVFADGMISKIE